MNIQAVLFGFTAGLVTFIMSGGFSELLVTNVLLGFIIGILLNKKGNNLKK